MLSANQIAPFFKSHFGDRKTCGDVYAVTAGEGMGEGEALPLPAPQGKILKFTIFKGNFLASERQFNGLLSLYNAFI